MSDEAITTTAAEQGVQLDERVRALIEAGVFYGRKKTHTNPRMKGFVLHNRNGIEIFNLMKTLEAMDAARAFLTERSASPTGLPLLVATQPAFASAVAEAARELNAPVVTKRWVGGSLTNFSVIAKRIEHLKRLRSDLASGAYEKRTKKERVMLDRERERLEELIGGLELMARVPDVLVVIDPATHATAIREAKRLRIPVVTLANVDADPDSVTHLVPGNSKGTQSVRWFLANVVEAIKEGRAKAPAVVAPGTGGTGTGGTGTAGAAGIPPSASAAPDRETSALGGAAA